MPSQVRSSRGMPVAVGFLVAVLVAVILTTPVASVAEAGTQTPVLQTNRLTPQQMAAFFRSETRSPYNATVSIEDLAYFYVIEGRNEGVAGDIAFAQAILETAWFSFPSTGQVRGSDNNFAGMGAYDNSDGAYVFRFKSARLGIRAQLQHLRIYSDPSVNSTGTNLGSRIAEDVQNRYPDRWRLIRNSRVGDVYHYWARAQNWEDFGGGMWATDPQYSQKVLGVYARMLDHASRNGGTATSRDYGDVRRGSSHARDISALRAAGLTNGCWGGHVYCPDRAVTRGEMASFLVRAANLAPTDASYFADVPASHTHHATINALAEAGFTNGCGSENFCPQRRVTRAEMASFLQRVTGLPYGGQARFTDVRYDATHGPAISAIADDGLTNGCGDGSRFCPDRFVSRQEMASFIRRAFLS